MCFSFTLKTDLIKEENSQTLTQMLETSYVLHDFTLLDSLPFSRSSLSVSQQRSGSCYSHGKLPVTTTVRHVSILHWRRTRQRVNTTVLRERYRRRGGTRKRKIQTDKKRDWERGGRKSATKCERRKTKRKAGRRRRRVNVTRIWARVETSGQIEAWERSDGVGADTELSCGMRRKTGSDMLQRSPPLMGPNVCLYA